MSSTVRSYGLIGLLREPITDPEKRDDINDCFFANNGELSLNHEGTLLIMDKMRSKGYRERTELDHFSLGNELTLPSSELLDAAAKFHLSVIPTKIQPFSCIWYNGSDAPFNELTANEFLDKCVMKPYGT